MRSIRSLLVSIVIAMCLFACAANILPPDGPGTFSRDANGSPHGTGWAEYYYPTGQRKLKEAYKDGKCVHASWYKPDGSLVASENYIDQTGTSYYLRDDGSIKSKFHYVHGLADGQTTYYKEDGSTDHVARFKNGQEVK